MNYLIFNTEQLATTRSGEIATNKGCSGNITHYWFSWVVSYTNSPLTALIIPDDQINLLTPQEQSELKDQNYMDSNGWFPPPLP